MTIHGLKIMLIISMGSFKSAQIADLVDINILSTLGGILNLTQIGLYTDDWLIFKSNSNSPKTSKLKKKNY